MHQGTGSQFALGLMYAAGEGVPQDAAEAERLIRLAAEQGDGMAQFLLWDELEGAEALRWVRRAAEQDHAWAQFYLGLIYDAGAIKNMPVFFRVEHSFQDDFGVLEDDAEALRWYRLAWTEQGHAWAQNYVSDIELRLAAEQGAEQGDAAAQFELGNMYVSGRGLLGSPDVADADAVRLWRLAAAQGYAEAAYSLDHHYDYGTDAVEAVRWFGLAAEQGHVDALPRLLRVARGDPEAAAEAGRWLRQAGEQGHAGAQANLGVMYANGDGVPQDAAEAVRWYRLAAEQGHAQAQFNLGIMYDTGRGVPQDNVSAHMWLNLAAAQSTGEDRARYVTVRDRVAEGMTREDLSEAQRRAREWSPE